MSFRDALDLLRFPERAELLGAIYGDGSIERKSRRGQKVSVGVSDVWPQWLSRVPELFEAVFGRYFVREKKRRGDTRFFEFYLTTHDPLPIFGTPHKYDADGRIVPPLWVSADEEFLRCLLRGLVETDGNFYLSPDGTPEFRLSQKNDYLSAWFVTTVSKLGYPCYMVYAEAAGVNQPQIGDRQHAQRFGEWLQSEKWRALIERGFEPKPAVLDRKAKGRPVKPQEAIVHKTIRVSEQEQWREWRRQGASYVAIALHTGRSNSVVRAACCDIVPDKTATPEELGLKPRPRYPRAIAREEVEKWRAAAREGESARQIAKRCGVKDQVVQHAVADIRWDLRMEKKRLGRERMNEMMAQPQGHAPWSDR